MDTTDKIQRLRDRRELREEISAEIWGKVKWAAWVALGLGVIILIAVLVR